MKIRYITPLVAAAGAAAAIIAAPAAMAADTGSQSCNAVPGVVDSVCVTPGNAELNDSAPIQFGPQYPYWEGDYYGGRGFGYGHGGGGHR